MDHARSLGHAADANFGSADVHGHADFLGVGVGGHHGPGQRVAAAFRQFNLLHAGLDEGHGQFDADDAGAEDQHLLGLHAQGAGGDDRHFLGVDVALLAHPGVGYAGVDHQPPQGMVSGQGFAVDGHRGRDDAALGEHPGRGAGCIRQQHPHVHLVVGVGLDSGIGAAGPEPPDRGDGAAFDLANRAGHGSSSLQCGLGWRKTFEIRQQYITRLHAATAAEAFVPDTAAN